MDPKRLIESTRRNLQRAQGTYSNSDYRKDCIKKPFLLSLIGDRRHDAQYRDQRLLLERGMAVWGQIIQANRRLFDPGQSHLEPQGEFFRSSRLSQASTGSGLDGRRGIRARKLRCGRKDFCNAYTAPCNFYMLRQPA